MQHTTFSRYIFFSLSFLSRKVCSQVLTFSKHFSTPVWRGDQCRRIACYYKDLALQQFARNDFDQSGTLEWHVIFYAIWKERLALVEGSWRWKSYVVRFNFIKWRVNLEAFRCSCLAFDM